VLEQKGNAGASCVNSILGFPHATDEILKNWRQQEFTCIQKRVQQRGSLDSAARSIVLKLLSRMERQLCKSSSMPSVWFKAVQLFDLSSADLSGASQAQAMPRAIAAFGLALHGSGGGTQIASTVLRDDLFCSLVKGDPAIVLKDIDAHERRILNAASLDLNAPNVTDWMTAICSRFSQLTKGAFSQHLVPVIKMSHLWARVLVQKITTSLVYPSRNAQGICSILLIVAGLLPWRALCSTHLDPLSDWDNLCSVVRASGSTVAEPIGIHFDSTSMADALECAAGSAMCNLESCAADVLQALKLHYLPKQSTCWAPKSQ